MRGRNQKETITVEEVIESPWISLINHLHNSPSYACFLVVVGVGGVRVKTHVPRLFI